MPLDRYSTYPIMA